VYALHRINQKGEGSQPIMLKYGKESSELYHNQNFLESTVETSAAVYAKMQNLIQQQSYQ